MNADIRASAFHETAHAVIGVALGHNIKYIRIDPRPGVRLPGSIEQTVDGPGDLNLLNEECAIVKVIGGLAERKHDENWTPASYHRDDDLDDVRTFFGDAGSRPEQFAAFLKRCDEIASDLLERECLWNGIVAVAENLCACVAKRPDTPRLFAGACITSRVRAATPAECLLDCAEFIRCRAPELNALRR
jgi:hypothetical protein